MMIPKSDTRSGSRSTQSATPATPTTPRTRARRSRATGTASDQRRDSQPLEANRRPLDSTTREHRANTPERPDYSPVYTTPWRTAASDYVSESAAVLLQPAILTAQCQAEWFEESYRAFAAWCAWWQASFGLPLAAAPFAGGVNGWWWASYRTLPFAGIG